MDYQILCVQCYSTKLTNDCICCVGIIDEDSSVVFATFAEAPPTNPELSFLGESTITPTSEENADSAEISIPHVSDKQTAPNKIADTTPTIKEGIPQEVSTEQVDLTTTESEMKPEDSTVVLKRAGIMDKVDNLAGAVEELDVSFREFPKESTSHTSQSGAISMLPQGQRSRNQSTSPNKSGRSGLTLCLANCVLKVHSKHVVLCIVIIQHKLLKLHSNLCLEFALYSYLEKGKQLSYISVCLIVYCRVTYLALFNQKQSLRLQLLPVCVYLFASPQPYPIVCSLCKNSAKHTYKVQSLYLYSSTYLTYGSYSELSH